MVGLLEKNQHLPKEISKEAAGLEAEKTHSSSNSRYFPVPESYSLFTPRRKLPDGWTEEGH
ncbi:hypothetical protein HC928_07585 [bacterium]|nr:hypothetical protein [bacterium]